MFKYYGAEWAESGANDDPSEVDKKYISRLCKALNKLRGNNLRQDVKQIKKGYKRPAPNSSNRRDKSVNNILSLLQSSKGLYDMKNSMNVMHHGFCPPMPFTASGLSQMGGFSGSQPSDINLYKNQVDSILEKHSSNYEFFTYLYNNLVSSLQSEEVEINSNFKKSVLKDIEEVRVLESKILKVLKVISILRYTEMLKKSDDSEIKKIAESINTGSVSKDDAEYLERVLLNKCAKDSSTLGNNCLKLNDMLTSMAQKK